jgi:hypothetical protein
VSTWNTETVRHYIIIRKWVVRVAGRLKFFSIIFKVRFGVSRQNLNSFVTHYLIHRDGMAIIKHNWHFLYNCHYSLIITAYYFLLLSQSSFCIAASCPL